MSAAYPRSHKGWLAYIADKQLDFLGDGVSRAVYALDSQRVVKVSKYGPGQSEHETKVWRRSDAHTRSMLARIYAAGDGWSIQERAICTLDDAYQIHGLLQDDLYEATGICDLHENNLGYFGFGRFKIIDYGSS